MPAGNVLLESFLFRFKRSAEVQAVEAVLHHDIEHHCWLAIVADQERGWVFIPTLDGGDIG